MNGRVEATVVRQFEASAERVYDAWLDRATVRLWMKAALVEMGFPGDLRRIEIDPRVGGGFVFSDVRDGIEVAHRGTYLALDRPHRIVFTWMVGDDVGEAPSRVTIRIEPSGEGCRVTLVHEMEARWADFVPQTERGWAGMLDAIDALRA